MELQRDVPQYIAIPWLMTWVMARTVSVREKGDHGWGICDSGPAWGWSADAGGVPGGGSRLQRHLASSVCTSWLLELNVGVGEGRFQEERKWN